MKQVLFLMLCVLSNLCHGFESIQCKGTTAIQAGIGQLQQESEFNFQLDSSIENNPIIINFSGYFNIKAPDTEGEEITPENGYRALYSIAKLEVNPYYNPRKYFGWFQFKNINASFTDSIENGTSGNLILDLNLIDQKTFEGKYLFQAGSHIGGTLNLSCNKNISIQ